MAFKGVYSVTPDIVIDSVVLEHVSHFNYLGCALKCKDDKDVTIKVQNICGTVARTLRRNGRKETQIRLYKIKAVAAFFCGSECWVPRQENLRVLQTAETKFLREVRGVHDRIEHVTMIW